MEMNRRKFFAALGLAAPSSLSPGERRASSRVIRGRSASRGFVAGYRSSPRSRLGASAANRSPAAALRSVFGLAFRPRPNKRWRLPVRRLLRAPALRRNRLVRLPASCCLHTALVAACCLQQTGRALRAAERRGVASESKQRRSRRRDTARSQW